MVAILTGASGDIGQDILKYLLTVGYRVYAMYYSHEIDETNLENTSNLIKIQFDLSRLENIENLVKDIIEKENQIDVLINCAGISDISQIQDISYEKYMQIINVNLNAPFLLSKEVSKQMIRQKSGHIINITSIWGLEGASCEVAYSTSKSGLIGMTKALAKELGPSNIYVNAIAPGYIKTKMNENVDFSQIKEEVPLNKAGLPKDITSCIAFILNNTYLTRQIISIDGGWH